MPDEQKKSSWEKVHDSVGWFRNQFSRASTIFILACLELIAIFFFPNGILSTPLNTLLGVFITAPILYIIWSFRDNDKQKELENSRIDTLTKDFHQIKMWATKADKGAPESLQIAAIHQLGPYLTGEHGIDFFRRPAHEIYRSLLDGWREPVTDEEGKPVTDAEGEEIYCHFEPPKYVEAIHTAIREILLKEGRWKEVFTDNLPIRELNFYRANLYDAHLEGAKLTGAHLEGAKLFGANLVGAKLFGANLVGADLRVANLEAPNLTTQNTPMAHNGLMVSIRSRWRG